MSRMTGLPKAVFPLLALAASLALASPRAEAQVKPLKITGGGSAPDGLSLIPYTPAPHNATGHATELGKYTGQGWFQILDFTGPLSGEFSSAPNFVFVAANGDHLAMTYGDTSNGAAERKNGGKTGGKNGDGTEKRERDEC
jgi:hypothetical protein